MTVDEEVAAQARDRAISRNTWSINPLRTAAAATNDNGGTNEGLSAEVGKKNPFRLTGLICVFLMFIGIGVSVFFILRPERKSDSANKLKPRTTLITFNESHIVCMHNETLHVMHIDQNHHVSTTIKSIPTSRTLLSVKYHKRNRSSTTEVFIMGKGPFKHNETSNETQAAIQLFLHSKEVQLLPFVSYDIGMIYGITGVHAHHSLPIHHLALSIHKQMLSHKPKKRRRLTHKGEAYTPQDAANTNGCYTSEFEVSHCPWMLDETSTEMNHRCEKCAYPGETDNICNNECTDGSDHGWLGMGKFPHHCPPCGEIEFRENKCKWYCTVEQMNFDGCADVARRRREEKEKDDAWTSVWAFDKMKNAALKNPPYSVGRPLLKEVRDRWTCASARFRNNRDWADAFMGSSGKLQNWYTSGGHCLGMCGPECTCWPWVCGDCGWHSNCFHHDVYWCETGHKWSYGFSSVSGCVFGVNYLMRHWDSPSCFGTILTRDPIEIFDQGNQQCQWTGVQRQMIWRIEKDETRSITCKSVPQNSQVEISCHSYKQDSFTLKLNDESIKHEGIYELPNAGDYKLIIQSDSQTDVAHIYCEVVFSST